jgi:nifR3 family TIM-barrel protein
MISSEGLCRYHRKTLDYLKSDPAEQPLSVQIFGSNPGTMAQASQIAVDHGAQIVDLNMGCPVKKVVKTGAGAALMRTPKLAAEIITSVRRACKVSLTVKIRAGWSPNEANAPEFAQMVQDCGVDALTVHGRFANQGYSGKADWALIKDLKTKLKIPLIGNGDISQANMALEAKNNTGCDGVMIGRGALGNPWLFEQILALEKGLPVPIISLSKRKAFILEHFHLLCHFIGEYKASLNMRGLLLWYTKGLPHSTQFRADIVRIKNLASLQQIMESYFMEMEEQIHESQTC